MIALRLAVCLACLSLALVAQAEARASQSRADVLPEATRHIIVKFKAHAKRASEGAVPFKALRAIEEHLGLSLDHYRAMSGGADVIAIVEHVSYVEARAIAARIAAHPDVEYAEPDSLQQPQLVPNDPFYAMQWHYSDPQVGINLPAAWDITTGSPGVVVAIIDSGSRPHADLAANLLPGYDMISNATKAGDGNGRDADASDEGSFVSEADAELLGIAPVASSVWHGLHVGGTVGAVGNNGLGVTGVAYGTRQFHVRVLGKGGGTISDIVDGMRWAAGLDVPGVPANANPARILNLSLGGRNTCGPTYQSGFDDVIARGALVVVAAGNANIDVAEATPSNCQGSFIRVGATDRLGGRASYSNYSTGAVPITISAPGGTGAGDENAEPDRTDRVLSLWNEGRTFPAADTYIYSSGTSYAAPHVAGVAALMLSVNPNLTADQVITIMQRTVRTFATNTGGEDCTIARCGAGLIDAAAAVRAAGAGGSGAESSFTALWWNPAESGWGVNLNNQGNLLFATLFTYEAAGGAPMWLVMSGGARQADGVTFSGPLYRTTGPAFNANPFTGVSVATVGTMSVTFSSPNAAVLNYTVNGVTVRKDIQRQVFGSRAATCVTTTGNRATAANYQDLWWKSDESGWGLNITQQDQTLFATLFTYDASGKALWLVMSAGTRQADGSYQGDLFQTTGPAFNAQPFTSIGVTRVGTMRLLFANGESATLTYSVNGIQVTKAITRQTFASPVPTCTS